MNHVEHFAAHRDLLFTVAYEMLGLVADAEDVVQDTWLRWAEVDLGAVEHPRAYLVRITTRLALNRLRTVERRRETYVGPWLPEPVVTTPDVADDVALADSVSYGLMVVLDRLEPLPRAVFVLREMFGFDHATIADVVDRSPAAVRQIASRARRTVRDSPEAARAPRADEQRLLDAFFAAAAGGNLQALMDCLAPDVVLLADGGGVVGAARRPVTGADAVARFVLGLVAKHPGLRMEPAVVNGSVGVRVVGDGGVDSLAMFHVVDGRVDHIYSVRNPEKLTGADGRAVTLG